MFIAIIHLISVFCEESEKPNAAIYFKQVSSALNESNRETALFNCLDVPSDEVKLAVVECLDNVSLSEFENEEIDHIIRQLTQNKNIGAGKTEVVLAKVLWILTKMTKD
jgi:hypothetical protein